MNDTSFNSEHWFKDFCRLAEGFLTSLNKKTHSSCLHLDQKRLLKVKDLYFYHFNVFKTQTYGSNKNENKNLIDHHKIIAIYIKSILLSSPFVLEYSKDKVDKILGYANEYFCLLFMKTVLRAWNDRYEAFNFSENEQYWFILLLNHFRVHPKALDIISLSQLIYYIEKDFLNIKK